MVGVTWHNTRDCRFRTREHNEGPGEGLLAGRRAGRRDGTPPYDSIGGASTAVVVWCECEVNDVSLPYSQPVWTACH